MSGPRTAMVLAAGLGTRMRPLTNDRPKALVEVGGRVLIDHMLDRLAQAGVETAVVNVHAFADRLEAHLMDRDATGVLSVAMFEAVGRPNYQEYFDGVARLMKDDGVGLVHSIGRPEPGVTNGWIDKYIFPGGYSHW
eukprot:gene46185-biopygen31984